MSHPRADVALLVDFTDLRQSLCPDAGPRSAADRPAPEPAGPAGPAGPAAAGPAAAEPAAAEPAAAEASPAQPEADRGDGSDHPNPRDLARHLMRFASQVGRVALARAYADWSRCTDLARDLGGAQLEPVLVPATVDGEDRSHIRLVVDALEALYAGAEPDAYVLVTGDPTLLPLVQKLRADGSEVVVIAPSRTVSAELRGAADRYYALEDVLDGVEAVPARPRTWRTARGAGSAPEGDVPASASGNGQRSEQDHRRERPPHPTPVSSERDFEEYDWSPFVRLIDELEHRLPFVGVRYLVNKVLGLHNCGVDDPRLKRDLINRAVEEDMIEMYPVGNVGDRADPVTACRLSRESEPIVDILGKTLPPVPPPEHTEEDGGFAHAHDEPAETERQDAHPRRGDAADPSPGGREEVEVPADAVTAPRGHVQDDEAVA